MKAQLNIGKVVAGALSAVCAVAIALAVGPAGMPPSGSGMAIPGFSAGASGASGEASSAETPSADGGTADGVTGLQGGSGSQVVPSAVSADGSVAIDGEHEAGVVLVQFGMGADPEQLTEAFAALACLDSADVTESDIEEGFIALPVADGYNVADAVEALDSIPGAISPQPNYVYHLVDGGLPSGGLTAEEGAGLIAASVDEAVLEGTALLEALADVNDPYGKSSASSNYNWHLKSINAYEAWDMVKGDSLEYDDRVTVAILDSGYDMDHEDLSGGESDGVGGNVVARYDASGHGSGTGDIHPQGHGTHVAGIVAGIANNNIGVSGVSHNARILPIQVFYADSGKVIATSTTINNAYDYIQTNASQYNIRVVNMSLGSEQDSLGGREDSLVVSAVESAYSKGILTVCAAANSSTNPQVSVPYNVFPGDYLTHCLNVIALDSNRIRASYSNYNVDANSRAKDISAPGSDIYSTTFDGSYNKKSGTSMASPVVAGVAALMFTANPSLTPEQAISIIHRTALDLTPANSGSDTAVGFDQQTGNGEVDAKAAVKGAGFVLEGPSVTTVGGTLELTPATVSPSAGSWIWASSAPDVATVKNGVVTGISGGTAEITATSGGQSATKTVTVYSLAYSVDGNPAAESIGIDFNETISLTVDQRPSGTGVFNTWDFSLSDVSVLSGLQSGTNTITLTGKEVGEAYLIATLKEDASVAVRLKVKVLQPSSKLSLESSSATVVSWPFIRTILWYSYPVSYLYTGFPIEPAPVVRYKMSDGSYKTLSNGVDYTVAYADNENVGTATATITGVGSYEGSISQSFSIAQRSLRDTLISWPGDIRYTGAPVEPVPTLTLSSNAGDYALVQDKDFTIISYGNNTEASSNTEAGYATVSIEGKGNFSNSGSVRFAIQPASLSAAKVSATGWAWDGEARDPKVSVEYDGAPLVQDGNWTYVITKDGAEVAPDAVRDAGTYTVTVTGEGNYCDTATTTFTVMPRSIEEATVSAVGWVLDGKIHDPQIQVSLDGGSLERKGNWTSAVSKDGVVVPPGEIVDAGTYTVTVTGEGNYGDSATTTFEVTPGSIQGVEASAVGWAWDGSVHDPQVKVMVDGISIPQQGNWGFELEKDGKPVSSDSVLECGTYKVAITGAGNYTGSTEASFEVVKTPISSATVSGLSAAVYTGQPLTPPPTLTLSGGKGYTLVAGVDYTVDSYANNTEASANTPVGHASVTITGSGNFSGTRTDDFVIKPASLAKATVNASGWTYDGKAHDPRVSVTYNGASLAQVGNWTYAITKDGARVSPDAVRDTGTYTVTVTGKGNYDGSATTTFMVASRSIAGATVKLAASSYAYDGAPKQPNVVSVTLPDGAVLPEGGYSVSYSSNTAAGQATATVTGRGNYTGSSQASFTITQAVITEVAVSGGPFTYDGKAKRPAVTAKAGAMTLSAGDYAIEYRDNVNAGMATVVVTGLNNARGSGSAVFAIAPAAITGVMLSQYSFEYDGMAKTPAATAQWAGGNVPADSYAVVYSGNVEAGTGSVTAYAVDGGNFTGSASASFEIAEPAPIPVEPEPVVGSQVMFRLYNPYTGEHFYTADEAERDNVAAVGWSYEGAGWTAPLSGDPVYRLYNVYGGDHHYTPNAGERDELLAAGWSDEGIGWYSAGEGGVPLYREYNPNMFSCNHNYTADASEHAHLVEIGWHDEGIAWYGV